MKNGVQDMTLLIHSLDVRSLRAKSQAKKLQGIITNPKRFNFPEVFEEFDAICLNTNRTWQSTICKYTCFFMLGVRDFLWAAGSI